jgi:hypothetical protein
MRRLPRGDIAAWLAATLALMVSGFLVPSARATFGANGPIAFRHFDSDTGFGRPLFRAQPDGTGRRPARRSSRPLVASMTKTGAAHRLATTRSTGSSSTKEAQRWSQ